MQCGVTCLQMICKHYGKKLSIETLSRYCFATTNGVSLLGISEAANKLGLHCICGRVSMEQMQEAPLPCILHWNQNHVVVLYKQKRGKKFYIADPGKGLVTYGRKEFMEHWVSTRSQGEEKGIAMFLQPTPLFYEQEGETHTGKRSFKFLFGYVKQYRRYFGQILLGALVGCLLQLVFPFLTQAIVENLMEFYRGKTVVVVAHRLSTVRNADQLVVVEKGSIVETGTHEELIHRQGAYWHLVKNQLELGG